MLLLGAGTSIEAGVPDAYTMTRTIVESFDPAKISPKLEWLKAHRVPGQRQGPSSGYSQSYSLSGHQIAIFKEYYPIYHVLTFVLGGLLMQRGIVGQLPRELVNVEELFSAVQLLAQRNQLEVAPFVGSWHPMVHLLDDRYSQRYAGRYYSSTEEQRFWEELRIPIAGYAKGEVFLMTSEAMTKRLREIVWIDDPRKVEYLKPIASLVGRLGKLTIATLNYDNGIELMSHSNRIQFSTGIEKWSSQGRFDFEDDGISLLKLHGSIDWIVGSDEPDAKRKFPQYTIRQVNKIRDEKQNYNLALVFGQRNKLTNEGPFLDLLEEFRRSLLVADTLTIVGYSFRDDHINAEIKRWINLTPNFRIRIVDPGFESNDARFALDLKHLCFRQLEIISDKASVGLERLLG